MPSFEECKEEYENSLTIDGTLSTGQNYLAKYFYEAGYSAATFAANSKLGDEGNEAEKVARRTVALRELLDCFTHIRPWNGEVLDAIIAKAQG